MARMKRSRRRSSFAIVGSLFALSASIGSGVGCDAGQTTAVGGSGSGTQANGSTGAFANSTGTGFAAGGGGGQGPKGDPKTCAQAAEFKTYLGCDFYPTVTANQVWDIFDFAVVVANAGDTPADVTVSGGGLGADKTTTIPANGAAAIYLPWVKPLKGNDFDACTSVNSFNSSVRAPGGAFHLTSSVPVTVYQFSALEFRPEGGPPGKDWSSCPGQNCVDIFGNPSPVPCFSFSNDASLLLPSTALTNNYRVAGRPGWLQAQMGSTLTVTGTEDGTNVTVSLTGSGHVLPGGGIGDVGGNGKATFTVGRGEVVELASSYDSDFSGALVQSDKPVQVLFGHPCTYIPENVQACDHVEESVFPAETLGKHYVITPPTSPSGDPAGQEVRFVGNVDGTQLTYPSGKPAGAPSTINAGQVVDMGVTTAEFEVTGDHEFAITTFQTGAVLSNPGVPAAQAEGDPAQSMATAVEQYRLKYVFLAPNDYPKNFIDVVVPAGTTLNLDGITITKAPTPIGTSTFGVVRLKLGEGTAGGHVLEASAPVGIQVMGYGQYTSYQYPGGLNLDVIAPPPPPPQ